jgi:hypothetical protein
MAFFAAAVGIYDLEAGTANALSRSVSSEVSTWATSPTSPRPDTVSSLIADLSAVASRAPDQPYVEELAGILAARRRDPDEMARAKSLFSKAAQGRPVSPYTWANIAHVDYELGQTGEEFEASLRHASELGPWEPAVQVTVVNYGLAVREEVSPSTRQAIDRMVASAMRRNPLETLQIAERRGRLDIACRELVNPGYETTKKHLQCEQWERTS